MLRLVIGQDGRHSVLATDGGEKELLRALVRLGIRRRRVELRRVIGNFWLVKLSGDAHLAAADDDRAIARATYADLAQVGLEVLAHRWSKRWQFQKPIRFPALARADAPLGMQRRLRFG